MFENYENIPTSYCPGKCPKHIPDITKVKMPLEQYNVKGELIGYTWNAKDTIILSFETTGIVTFDDGTMEDMDTYFGGKTVQLELIDFRYEVVYSNQITYKTKATVGSGIESDLPAVTEFYISPEDCIPKGTYKPILTLIDKTENEDKTTTLISSLTLVSPCDYTLTIN